MGKRNSISNERIIYKNSNNTFNTYSKICSSASKIFTKSLIMELKKNISTNNFYEADGKLKRDLSIETDVCKIVRYCRKNLKKPINRLDITENKRFTNNTKMVTVDDFHPHGSGCGDSTLNCKQKNVHCNVDLTDLVIGNLKKLLNIWIKKYLLENNKTKQKIDTVLDSILHKLEFQASQVSSTCTYALDIEIIDQQKSSNISESYDEDQKQTKRSLYTIPLRGKHLQIISTLSLPRNLTKFNRKSLHRIKKHSNKYIYVSMKRNSMHRLGLSSLNILSVSTNTLTRQCATYKNMNYDKHADKKWTTYNPRLSNSTLYTNESDFDILKAIRYAEDTNKKSQLKKKPSLYETISVKPEHENGKPSSKEPINCIEKQNNSQALTSFISDTKTHKKSAALSILNLILEQKSKIHCCENSISKFDNNIDFLHDLIDKINKPKKNNRIENINFPAKRINKILKKMLPKRQIRRKIESQSYSYSHKKSRTLKQKEITKHFETILQYFANSFSNKDLKFDVHINVFPANENFKKERKSSNQPTKLDSGLDKNVGNPEYKIKPDLKKNTVSQILKPSMAPLILPLLDGAINPVKYLKSTETSTELCNQLANKEKNNKLEANKINITHEICDLREIVKELKAAAEKIVTAHLSNKTLKNIIDPVTDSKSKNKKPRPKCDSRGIQLSYLSPKSNITSGLKLQKSPRNRARKDNLMKKSTSYHIINSETILKVTDMTSAAADVNTDKVTDEALTCSFPKSKSLFEISIASNKDKLIAFYCDDFVKPNYACNQKLHSTCCSCIERPSGRFQPNPSCSNNYFFDHLKSECKHKLSENADICSTHGNCGDSSSILINVCQEGNAKKFTLHNRRVGYWEGCCYCILLWIPVIVILCLLYEYVFQDIINKIRKSEGNSKTAHLSKFIMKHNKSQLPFKLSDLGF